MRSSLEIYDIARGEPRVVLQTDMLIEAPNWSPDGSYLLINGEGRLYRVPLDAPQMIALDTGVAVLCNNDHGISPDGTRIILSSHHDGQGSEIYMIPAAGGEPERVSPNHPSWWHGWAPDGRTIAYVAARAGSRVIDVYTLRLNGGTELRLTNSEGHCDGPDYSADGAQIYYNCDRGGHAQIWIMDANGANQRQLFSDEQVNWFPHPSPCGRYLLFLAYPPGTQGHPRDLPVELVLCAPDGSDQRRILAFNGGQGTMNVPNWAPDGNSFAFVRFAEVDD